MSKKLVLKFTWVGKENQSMVEPRILLEVTVPSYHAKRRNTNADF
ncbi:hypothetical protein MASR1M60_18530 [Rhodocyclaceae bacterium]